MGCLQSRSCRLPGEVQSPEHGLLRNSFWPTAPTHRHSFGVHLSENELAAFEICVHVQEGTGEGSGRHHKGSTGEVSRLTPSSWTDPTLLH